MTAETPKDHQVKPGGTRGPGSFMSMSDNIWILQWKCGQDLKDFSEKKIVFEHADVKVLNM